MPFSCVLFSFFLQCPLSLSPYSQVEEVNGVLTRTQDEFTCSLEQFHSEKVSSDAVLQDLHTQLTAMGSKVRHECPIPYFRYVVTSKVLVVFPAPVRGRSVRNYQKFKSFRNTYKVCLTHPPTPWTVIRNF